MVGEQPHPSKEVCRQLEEIEYFDDVYPLYEVQATIGVNSSAAKAQEAFVLYGIDSQYCGIEMEEQENSIFIPPNCRRSMRNI